MIPMNEVGFYIPSFNAGKTIGPCLEAVLGQSYPVKEVVVFDDGSTDGTADLAVQFPVKLLRHSRNRGLAATRNDAIRALDTEFVASIDSDCVIVKDWLKNLMESFRIPRVAGAGGRLLEKYRSSGPDLWRSVHMRQSWGDEKTSPDFLFGSNTVFRREALMKAGPYNENFKTNYEDVDLCRRLRGCGYVLNYEPKAIVHHLRRDDLSSVMNNYWKWYRGYYEEEKFYSGIEKFIFKLKENIGTANRFLEEDLSGQAPELFYLDFFFAFHHSLMDLGYFVSQDQKGEAVPKNPSGISSWLSLLDLVFFYHFDGHKEKASTLMPRPQVLLQNYFALTLVLGSLIREVFKGDIFDGVLFRHLLGSLYGVSDPLLSEKLSKLIGRRQDWSSLLKKSQPNLNQAFLEALSSNFRQWLYQLRSKDPDIFKKIERSAEKITESDPQ
jgi:glycosyltransferase involved in cell wall biosynthesis